MKSASVSAYLCPIRISQVWRAGLEILWEFYSIDFASGLSSSQAIPRQTPHPTYEHQDTGISCSHPPSFPKMLETTAGTKPEREVRKGSCRNSPSQDFQQFTQPSVPAGLCRHRVSPSTSQGSPSRLLLQSLVLIFLPHLSLSSSSLLLLTYFLTTSLPPAHPSLPQTNPYHKCLEKHT